MAEFGLKLRVRRDDSELKNRTLTRRKLGWAGQDVTIWILSAIFFVGCHGYQEQRFAMEPQDQSAIVGSRVTLPCRVEHKVGNLQWTKDDFGLGTHRNLSGYERYAMIGSDEEGDYSLDIRDVSLEDDGLYQCQVSSGLNGEPPIRSRSAHLSVLIAPEPPIILQGAFIEAIENQPVTIECVSEGGKPAAEITWVDGNDVVIRDDVESKVEMLPDEQRFRTRSVLRLVPSAHLERVTCQAQNTADRAFRMATLAIEVKYPPKINITKTSGRVFEGGDARVRCSVDANPPADKFSWYMNNKPVIGDYKEELVIFNVSRIHNKAAIRCEVSNSAGKSEAGLTLNVTYPPSFRTRPQNIESVVGSNVTLFCDVDGHPKPKIRWLFHEPGRIGVKGKTASFNVMVDVSTAGRYICKATVEGYPEIETEAIIFIKGPPKFLSNRTQTGIEGETVRVECSSLCVPKPDDIRWYFEGREISAILDPDYATLVESLPDGVSKSSLVIRASQSKHYGVYNCSVTNEYGNDNVAITLKPLKSLPLVIILIGVTCGIIIFSAFVILLVLCNRRRRKNSHINEKPDVTVTTTDMYKESDRSSNISDLKLQLPQSDGSYDLEYTSSDRSDSKPQSGLPLAGPVIPNIHSDSLMFRYSNDYSDPTYNDHYFKNPNAYVYDYPQGYAPPPHLRVQSPTIEVPPTRSLQGSLTRSIDTASTLPLSAGNGSQNNSLKRTNKPDENDAINNLGLPVGGEVESSFRYFGTVANDMITDEYRKLESTKHGPQVPVYAQAGQKHPGVDVRYAATYGNPYLRNSSMGYQVHTAKPASTPAPPPYSRNLPGNGTHTTHATHV